MPLRIYVCGRLAIERGATVILRAKDLLRGLPHLELGRFVER